jgi:hypothetical protein
MSAVDSAAEDRDITLRADEADDLLDVLEEVVVSLDRMGSRQASGEDPEHTWTHEYFTTGGATIRLSRARGILLKAFRRVHTEDELDARWGERPIEYWNDGHTGRP